MAGSFSKIFHTREGNSKHTEEFRYDLHAGEYRRKKRIISRPRLQKPISRQTLRQRRKGRSHKIGDRSHDAVIPVYDAAGNVIETHQHAGKFREP
ncbi:MAG: hypothetical protein AUH19_10600 [Verrucomicrobia bacterium 13_2_20CM_55_10]|nr:MAG: hypothetical protein AUH19_10600 [Verrucomicrobia bacterium 13_2_20CM_55_10]PYI66363.1 MAG: hypothetical protein DMF07_04060 [Verrucomicrobiota bacterium]